MRNLAVNVTFLAVSVIEKENIKMLSLVRFSETNISKCISISRQCQQMRYASGSENNTKQEPEQEFRVLDLNKKKTEDKRTKFVKHFKPHSPRFKEMDVRQDWGSVWPGPRSFHPATVPLPIRQGYTENNAPPPDKFANAELMKIPNFLHLTPPVIKRQCEALKKFCTPWPEGLETDEKCEKHFPIEFISSDYVHGLPTIRNPLSRIVTIKLKLSVLPLDKHARDKFCRLVEGRHDPETDYLTIVVDRCPLRKQNFEYAQYLLAALFHESFIVEDWEATKTEADMEYYDWNRNKSKETTEAILNWKSDGTSKKEADVSFATSVENLINEGENEYNISKYKEEAVKLLGLKTVIV